MGFLATYIMKRLSKSSDIFLKEKNKDIYYKYKSGHEYFLIMNPLKKGKDKRVPFDKMVKRFNDGKVNFINKNTALMEVSRIYSDYSTDWEFDGRKFKVMSRKYYEDNGVLKNYLNDLPLHEFVDINSSVPIISKFKLVWFQGHLYWIKIWHYYPKVCLYKFRNVNEPPNLGKDFVLWTHVKNIKPIIDCETNKFI